MEEVKENLEEGPDFLFHARATAGLEKACLQSKGRDPEPFILKP